MAKTKKEPKAKKTKPKGPAQTEIPGTERKKIPEVEEAFADWDDAKAKRLAAKVTEDTKYETVIAAMRDAGVTVYKFPSQDGTTVTITLADKTKVKVHKAKPDAFRDEGDE